MTNTSMLTHEVAFDLLHERIQASTEAGKRSLKASEFASVRRAVGAKLISLGEWLTGSNAMATTAGAR